MDDQTLFTLMVDLHRDGSRQGPGSDEETLRALDLARLDRAEGLQVADIGCGTGASTLVLASTLPSARIIAVDLFPEFLDILMDRARTEGCSEQIETLAESMDSLSFAAESLDLIWAEGAIYNMGFSAGIEAWKSFLRQGGVIAVSEITWLRPDPPEEILQHWNSEYPEIATAPDPAPVVFPALVSAGPAAPALLSTLTEKRCWNMAPGASWGRIWERLSLEMVEAGLREPWN